MRFVFLIAILLGVKATGFTQDHAALVNARLLARMTDSLQLDPLQVYRIDSINNALTVQKNMLRLEFTNIDSLTKHIQLVERSRDSLYQIVLPFPTYFIYKEKKRNLISNN